MQQSHPHVQPQATEVAEMARRANEVVRLLEELRRLNNYDPHSSPGHGAFRSRSNTNCSKRYML